MSGGSAGSAYAAEISALQTYQKQILSTLDNLVASEAVIAIVSGFSGTGANSGLGTFPEAVELGNAYTTVMQNLMTNFKEISALVTTMANVLGKSAQNYMETEQQLTDSFNKIVSQYESQTGSFSTPGSPTATAPTGTSAQTGTSSAYNSATPATTTSGTTTTSTSSGSIEQENDSNESNDTSSEE